MTEKTGYLIAFKLKGTLSGGERRDFFRTFYGYKDFSCYGKYYYNRTGFLTKNKKKYHKLIRGVIVIKKEDFNEIVKYLRSKATVHFREVFFTQSDIKKLY